MPKIQAVMKGPNEILPFDHPFIRYPQIASVKMDGFRLLNLCGEHLLSPALKPFPNQNMTGHLLHFLRFCSDARIVTDGEFWSPSLTFQELQSIVRSHNKSIPNDVKYYIFDAMSEEEWDNGTEKPFINRMMDARGTLADFPNVVVVPQEPVNNATEAERRFDAYIESGEEGIILRAPSAIYKHGRTTTRQDGMWKFKQFITHDAVIIGVEQGEMMKPGIYRATDAQGRLERTYRQEDYEPVDMVGAFTVMQDGITFKVKPGKGHDHAWKRFMWEQRDTLIGKHLEYKFMPHGTMDKPRIGNLVCLRPDLD